MVAFIQAKDEEMVNDNKTMVFLPSHFPIPKYTKKSRLVGRYTVAAVVDRVS